MKNGKMLILLMTAVLLLLAAGIGQMEPAPQPVVEVNIPLSVTVERDGRQEQIRCWMEAEGDWVVFLPSGVKLADVTVSPKEHALLTLNQEPLEQPTDCGGFQTDISYALTCTAEGMTSEHTLTFLQSARLPSMHLDVQSGSMDLIHEVKGNPESGSLRLYSETGELHWSGPIESIRGRGNTSWLQDKKPYSMTLAGEADLLGMGQAKEWILLANALDPSHLRNKAVYDLAAGAGMAYTPDSQWVDLYLNGDYAGLYLLCERNEIHSQRVDIPETNSFLVAFEPWWRLVQQNYPRVRLDSGTALRIHDSGVTRQEIHRVFQPVENAILADDGRDPISGKNWQELIDLDSWVMEYLTGEIFGNVDAGIASSYLYRDGSEPSGKIYAGPVWDYDLAMGSESAWQAKAVRAFFVDREHVWELDDTTWAYELNRRPEFLARVRELYREVYRPLVQELLDTGLEDYAQQISQAAMLDQRRWSTEHARAETENIRRYMTERLAFLDSVWLDNVEYCRVLVMQYENSSAFSHAVLPGEQIPFLPVYEESWDILGWYDAQTEQPFDSIQPIYRDTVVYLKKLPVEEDRISPLQAAPFGAVLGILILLLLADRKRRGAGENGEISIAKQEIM